MDISPKDSQTLFSKLHNMSYSRSYIKVCSYSRTWRVNHACPEHNKRNAALENHCTGTAWPMRIGCCRRGHNIYRLSIPGCEKGNIFVNIYFWHILCLLLSLIYPAVYLLNKDLCELSISRYSTWVMPKRWYFSLNKGWKAFLFMFWNICLA